MDSNNKLPRIKSINIPPARRMGGNVKRKYDALMEEMKNFTGAPAQGQSLSFNPYPLQFRGHNTGFENTTTRREPLVLFYGFNGMLAQKYSIIDNMGYEEITVRMQIAGDKVPYSIKDYPNFRVVIEQMQGTPNALSEISFDDAMNIIRIGIQKLQVEEFVDADEDEFDDNCVESCKPGAHACGK